MHPYQFDGLTVLFPFEAYQCQLDYMKGVVECLMKVCLFFQLGKITFSPLISTWRVKTVFLKVQQALARLFLYCVLHLLGLNNIKYIIPILMVIHIFSHWICWFIKILECLEAPVQIIYASRTHSQLAQVVKEFKSTDYKLENSNLQLICILYILFFITVVWK